MRDKYAPEFETFWNQAYPMRRGGKKAAFKSWNRAILEGATAQEIIAGAEGYKAKCKRDGTEEQFIAHATTWLNQGRWEDDYQPKQESRNAKDGWTAAGDSLAEKYRNRESDHSMGKH